MTGSPSSSAERVRRAVLLLALATCVICVLLLVMSYFSINHHMTLHRAGMGRLAMTLAAHPLRYAGVLVAIAIVLQLGIIRIATRDREDR